MQPISSRAGTPIRCAFSCFFFLFRVFPLLLPLPSFGHFFLLLLSSSSSSSSPSSFVSFSPCLFLLCSCFFVFSRFSRRSPELPCIGVVLIFFVSRLLSMLFRQFVSRPAQASDRIDPVRQRVGRQRLRVPVTPPGHLLFDLCVVRAGSQYQRGAPHVSSATRAARSRPR